MFNELKDSNLKAIIANSLVFLGYYYKYGYGIVDVDYDKAIEYFEKSIEIKEKVAKTDELLELSDIYFHIKRDIGKAKKYFLENITYE
jgi:TPR repeat protein